VNAGGSGTAADPYVAGVIVWNVYEYEAGAFYRKGAQASMEIDVYALDSSSTVTNNRTYYLDENGQIEAKMYKASTYYV